jgi:hypothetical protein
MRDNKVFAILKKTSLMKLKNSKVELAAIDDLDAAINSAESYSDVVFIDDALRDSDELIEVYEEFKRLAENYIANYDLDNWYSEFENKKIDLEDKLNQYETLTDELGIDANNSDTFRYGDELLSYMNDEFLTYDQNSDRFNYASRLANES